MHYEYQYFLMNFPVFVGFPYIINLTSLKERRKGRGHTFTCCLTKQD